MKGRKVKVEKSRRDWKEEETPEQAGRIRGPRRGHIGSSIRENQSKRRKEEVRSEEGNSRGN